MASPRVCPLSYGICEIHMPMTTKEKLKMKAKMRSTSSAMSRRVRALQHHFLQAMAFFLSLPRTVQGEGTGGKGVFHQSDNILSLTLWWIGDGSKGGWWVAAVCRCGGGIE